MTDKQRQIVKSFRELVNIPVQQMPCQVLRINSDDTVDVLPPTGPEIFDVRLKATIDPDDNEGIVLVPKVGSYVLVSIIGNNAATAAVVKYSAVDQVKGQIGNTKFVITGDDIVINGGDLGGMVKAKELKTQLDKTNAVVQAIVNSLSNWIVAPSDGGAALKTFFAGQISGKSVGNYSNLENEKVKH